MPSPDHRPSDSRQTGLMSEVHSAIGYTQLLAAIPAAFGLLAYEIALRGLKRGQRIGLDVDTLKEGTYERAYFQEPKGPRERPHGSIPTGSTVEGTIKRGSEIVKILFREFKERVGHTGGALIEWGVGTRIVDTSNGAGEHFQMVGGPTQTRNLTVDEPLTVISELGFRAEYIPRDE